MGTGAESHERDLLLAILDQAYDSKAWHGTNLRGSLPRARVLRWPPCAWLPAGITSGR